MEEEIHVADDDVPAARRQHCCVDCAAGTGDDTHASAARVRDRSGCRAGGLVARRRAGRWQRDNERALVVILTPTFAPGARRIYRKT